MVDDLMILSLRLNVLEEHNLKESSLQENVDQCWSHLNNSDIEEESRTEKRKMHQVINSCKTIVLFIWKRFNQVVVNSLLELSDSFVSMLKQLRKVRIITSDPFRSPSNFQQFEPPNQIAMNILEMKRVSSIFRNVLHNTIDFMNCMSSISVIFAELTAINHVEIRFNFWIRVNPNVNKSIHLFYWIFS